MKKFSYLFLSLFAFMALTLSSCTETDVEPVGPKINFLTDNGATDLVSSDATVEPGSSFKVQLNGTKGDEDLTTLTIKKDGVTISFDLIDTIYNEINKDVLDVTNGQYELDGDEQDGFTFTITLSTLAADEGKSTPYTFVLADKDGLTAEVSLTITNEFPSTASVVEAKNKVLGAQSASAGSYYSVADATVYSSASVRDDAATKAKINFSYAQTGETSASVTDKLISLNAREDEKLTANLGGGIDTYFAASSIDYANATVAQINGITASSSLLTTIEAGKTYEFVSGGTKGLIYVESISGDISAFTGTATISVKTVQDAE
ncbi:MAG: hypothetical protein GY827_07190 [Cytophagales bacterium]|nr:hypothetical protein [Cytophagales bacterium]